MSGATTLPFLTDVRPQTSSATSRAPKFSTSASAPVLAGRRPPSAHRSPSSAHHSPEDPNARPSSPTPLLISVPVVQDEQVLVIAIDCIQVVSTHDIWMTLPYQRC